MTPWQRAEIVQAIQQVFGPYESRELVAALPKASQPQTTPKICCKCRRKMPDDAPCRECRDCYENSLG